MKHIKHVINGQQIDSESGRVFNSINPATGAVCAEVAFGTVDDVEHAVQSAKRAFESGAWSNMSPVERSQRMRAVARLITERLEEIALLETEDTGKPLAVSRSDVAAAASVFDYFSQLPEHAFGKSYPDDAGFHTYSSREPYGVVAAIVPWNFPFMLGVWKVAPALAVGNSVVIKMAEETPMSINQFALICLEAGIPPGVVNVVHGDGPTTGNALVVHPSVPKISFTGSTTVGSKIVHASAESFKSLHLELGGKCPNIVFSDCDQDQALAGSLFTSFFNTGQICTSGSRLLVQESIAEAFVERLVERARNLVVGDPMQEKTQIGPLVSKAHFERVMRHVELGNSSGATLRCGGKAPDLVGLKNGSFISPTIFSGVNPDMQIAQQEIFGPVLSVLTFKDEDEAIAIANNSIYGLAATVWTSELGRALRVAKRIEAGIIWTNCPHHGKWSVPYEGHKASGSGEDLGMEAISTFTKLKVNYINYGGSRMEWGMPLGNIKSTSES